MRRLLSSKVDPWYSFLFIAVAVVTVLPLAAGLILMLILDPGIYCRIRDPFLLSGLLILWMTPFVTVNLLLIYIITSAYLFLGSLHWETRLQAQFREAYKAYQRKVPRMIPSRNKRWDSCLEQRDIKQKQLRSEQPLD